MESEGPLKNLEGDWTNVWSVTFHTGQVDFFTTSGVEPDSSTLLVGSWAHSWQLGCTSSHCFCLLQGQRLVRSYSCLSRSIWISIKIPAIQSPCKVIRRNHQWKKKIVFAQHLQRERQVVPSHITVLLSKCWCLYFVFVVDDLNETSARGDPIKAWL